MATYNFYSRTKRWNVSLEKNMLSSFFLIAQQKNKE